jgi:hypothetical protein
LKTATRSTTPARVGAAPKIPKAIGDRALAMTDRLMTEAFAGPDRVPSTNFSSEFNSIDFQKMIGGPLQACVNAQVASSLATVVLAELRAE